MRADWAPGAFIASAAAGPIVVAMLALVAVVTSRLEPFWPTIGFLILTLTFALPIGFAVSLVPNVLGSALLAWAGIRHPAARHPLVWAASGFCLGWLISAIVSGHLSVGNAALGAVGTGCALVCRRGVVWHD